MTGSGANPQPETQRQAPRRMKLTDDIAKAAKHEGSGDRSFYWDDGRGSVVGFGLMATAAGSRSWVAQYRTTGERPVSRRVTIGRADAIRADTARKRAKAIMDAVATGRDPSAEKRDARLAKTVGDLLTEWQLHCAERVRRGEKESTAAASGTARTVRRSSSRESRGMSPGTAADYGRKVETHIRPALGRLRPEDLTKARLETWKQKLPGSDGNVRSIMLAFSAFLGWLVARDIIPANPIANVSKPPGGEVSRPLSPTELERLVALLAEKTAAHPVHVAALRLLLLTGCRRGEVLGLRWADVDQAAGFLRVARHKTAKQSGVKLVVITEPVRAVLAQAERFRVGPFILPATRGAEGHLGVAALRKKWESWRREAELTAGGEPRLHDLRHNAGTVAALAGVPLEGIAAMLGHASTQTTQRYTRHGMANARSAAAEALAAAIGNVVAFPAPSPRKRRARA